LNHNHKCPSGLTGWKARLQTVYSSLAEFESYAEIYALHTRLGYRSPRSAWRANPMVRGSVNPSDYGRA
jgi:hypothetical protein